MIQAKEVIKKFIKKFVKSEKGEGAITYVLLVAGLITILAFVLLPGIKAFAASILTSLNTWFTGITGNLFGTI